MPQSTPNKNRYGRPLSGQPYRFAQIGDSHPSHCSAAIVVAMITTGDLQLPKPYPHRYR